MESKEGESKSWVGREARIQAECKNVGVYKSIER